MKSKLFLSATLIVFAVLGTQFSSLAHADSSQETEELPLGQYPHCDQRVRCEGSDLIFTGNVCTGREGIYCHCGISKIIVNAPSCARKVP